MHMTANNMKKAAEAANSNGPCIDTNMIDSHIIETANQGSTTDVDSTEGSAIPFTDTPTSDLIQKDVADELIQPAEPTTAPALHFRLLTGDELCNLPGFQWRIKGVLPVHGLAVLFGPSASGKSFLVLDLLQSLALGRDWFGHKVKQCAVTYVALEGEVGVANRVKAYQVRHGATVVNIRYVTQSFHLLDGYDINALAEAIHVAGTGDVVVLDTLSRAVPGSDENDSKAMGQIVHAAKLLQELIGGLVLLVHHTGKVAANGMRGHSSLHAALDCAIEVKRQGHHREWTVAKSKDGEDGASHPFKLEVVTLGIDDDGDSITSCVVVDNPSEQALGMKKQKLGKNQTIALNALKLSLSNHFDTGNDGSPQEEPSLTYEQAIEMVAPLMQAEAKHKKQRAKEALNGLEKSNYVGMNGDRLWIN
jgi:putative DNA primase/helicase